MGLNISGLLVEAGGRYLQVLEGPAEALEAVYASIQRDPRHCDLRLLTYAPADVRSFPDWALATERLTADSGLILQALDVESQMADPLSADDAMDLVLLLRAALKRRVGSAG